MMASDTQHFRGSGWPDVPVDRNPGAADRLPADNRPEGLRLRLIGIVWEVLWEAARRLPEAVALGVADVAGRLAYWAAPQARRRVRRTLSRAVGAADLEPTVREAFRSYARYWAESFRAADLDPDDVARRTESRGFEFADAVLDEGRGGIMVLAHHGSWDVAARWAESRGYHLAVVAEVVRPRRLFKKFVQLREAVGLEVVPLRRGGDPIRRLREVLTHNHIAGLLSDRDLSGKAPVVTLFGEACRIPAGPVLLSQRTGARIIPATMIQRPGPRWYVEAFEPIDPTGLSLAEGCQAVADAIERIIRLAPAQWHAFSPVYLADLPPRRERKARATG